MLPPILTTKLHIPQPRSKVVLRSRLLEQLDQWDERKLTLISAPAGFGKTTLVSSWIYNLQEKVAEKEPVIQVAWLSLDEGDSDPVRFLTYLVTALQSVEPEFGAEILTTLQSPQPPSPEAILTSLLNKIVAILNKFILVLDDYHILDSQSIDQVLTFLLEHLPPQAHFMIVTREDPSLPLARFRARGQLTELRATDLRFTPAEATEFLNQAMGLTLSVENIAALESRTEGWVAGLQLAALALQGTNLSGDPVNATRFIESFSGSHHFVLDYLVEEVLQQQSETLQTFLLYTAILDRMCGSLCDAVVIGIAEGQQSSQAILEMIETANLFIVPLDSERGWYRYHHLFADLLRQRLEQRLSSSTTNEAVTVAELHKRASEWYEANGLEIEAFQHAAKANDIGRAERLIEGNGMPLHFRGAIAPVLSWLTSLPKQALDAYPSLWTTYASTLLVGGQATNAEQKLEAAEAALQDAELNQKNRDIIGRIAAIRATIATSLSQSDAIIAQSHRALEYLHPENTAFRTSTAWKLGYAYQLQGDLKAARQAYDEVISIGQVSGNTVFTLTAMTSLAGLYFMDNQVPLAAETYQRILQEFDYLPPRIACEVNLHLARIFYEWNDLDTSEFHIQRSIPVAQHLEKQNRFLACQAHLARIKVAQGKATEASTILAETKRLVRQYEFDEELAKIVKIQVLIALHQGDAAEAAHLAKAHQLSMSQARLHLFENDPDRALAILKPFQQQMAGKGWVDEQLKVLALLALIYQAQGNTDQAMEQLSDALVLAEPSGFVRVFVDEGAAMRQLLSTCSAQGMMPGYIGKLLAAFELNSHDSDIRVVTPAPPQRLVEPLSERELEVLQLIAQGLSNREISQQLFLALDTVKGHNRRIFGKLQVQRRTEAVARAQDLGLL